jgi:hypothetical protein
MEAGWRKEYARYRGFFLNVAQVTQKRQDVKMFLEIVLTITTIVVFTIFALKPTLVTIAAVVKEIKHKEEVLAKMEKKLEDLAAAQIVTNENQEEIALLDTSVPKNPAPDTLSRQIEAGSYAATASLEGIAIEEVLLKGEAKKITTSKKTTTLPEGAKSLALSLTLKGDYHPVHDFLDFLETMRRPLKIDSIALTAKEASDTVGEIVGNISFAIIGQAPYLDDSQPQVSPTPAPTESETE